MYEDDDAKKNEKNIKKENTLERKLFSRYSHYAGGIIIIFVKASAMLCDLWVYVLRIIYGMLRTAYFGLNLYVADVG